MRKVKRKINVKLITAVLSFALLFAGTLGSSLAWLLAKTTAVTNTFTTSNINITLTETEGGGNREFQMIPGHTVDKDPTVTVLAGSEDCFVFVQVEESIYKTASNTDYYVYEVDTTDNWTPLKNASDNIVEGVYYKKVLKSDNDQSFNVLGAVSNRELTVSGITFSYSWTDNKMLIHPAVTEADMNSAKMKKPTITFTAYATQMYKSADGSNKTEFLPYEAWAIASSQP